MEGLDQLDQRLAVGVGAIGVRGRQRQLGPRQREQRRALGGVEPQRAGERLEHVGRGMDVTALLEPRVPGHPDPGERGQLLTPQSRRAAAGAVIRQADIGRRQPRAARAQECTQLVTPGR